MAKYDVFISYSRKDTAVADKICAAFDRAGISYFIDRQGIGGGMEFPVVLAEAIVESNLFLYLASMNSYESKFTTSEITFAFNEKPKNSLLPYIIDGSALPIAMKFIFSGINWRNTTDHPIETTLVDDICRLLGRERKAATQPTDNLGHHVAPEQKKTPQPTGDANTLYEEGIRLYDNKEYDAAIPFLTKAAEMGNALAQIDLGNCYYYGHGATKDYFKAVKWFKKSAEQGNANAQYNVGLCYYWGEGVTKNYAEAVRWYRLAAEQGHQEAQCRLGECYYNGEGVTQDFAEVERWYRKAAEQGHALAQYRLGNRYYHGQGVTKDYAEAVKWYRKSAAQGNEKARLMLSHLRGFL